MSVWKEYVYEFITEKGAVFEGTMKLALKEELDAERSKRTPELLPEVSTKELVKELNSNKLLGDLMRSTAAEARTPIRIRPSLVQKIKRWFS